MIAQDSVPVQLVRPIDRLPAPAPSTATRRHGSPFVYSDSLFLKALAIHDGRVAPPLIEELPREARLVLGDEGYDAEALKQRRPAQGRFVASPKRGP